MASKISVVINTLNEEKNIAKAIASVKSFADEVVVCDMESTDKTCEIATSNGAKVVKHEKVGYVEPARNFAISRAKNPWVFILDADEEVPKGLREKIGVILKNPKADYYRIPRKNIIFGKWIKHSRWWPDYNIRFFKKGSVSWNEIIHTVPMTKGVGDSLEDKESLAIVHHHYDSVEQYINRMNRYTSLHAKLKKAEGYKFSWKDVLKKPAAEFLSRYFFGQGYKDGIHGLSLALLQASSELFVYLKIWQAEKFPDKNLSVSEVKDLLKDLERDFHYWENDAEYRESGSITSRIRRKLRI